MNNLNWKKILLIIAFIAIVIAGFFGVYYLFFKTTTPTEPTTQEPTGTTTLPTATQGQQPGQVTPGTTDTGTGLPTDIITRTPGAALGPDNIAQGSITKVTDLDTERTTDIVYSTNNNKLITYNPDLGQFYTINNNGDKVQLIDKVYKNVDNITFNNSTDKAILEFPDGTNVMYDLTSKKQTTLPKDWTDFSFNQNGNQISFKDMNQLAEFRFFGVANPDGSNISYLEEIGDSGDKFISDWSPNGQIVGIYKEGATSDTSKLYFIGQNGENFKALTVNGYGVETKWTPDGQNLVYSANNFYSDHKPMLYLASASGDDIGKYQQSLNLNTWVDKCAFQNAEIMYCGVPKELPYGVEYAPEIADDIADYIYKVNLKTGVKTFVAEPEFDYSIEKMQVSDDGSFLYFTDKATNTLHTIKLK